MADIERGAVASSKTGDQPQVLGFLCIGALVGLTLGYMPDQSGHAGSAIMCWDSCCESRIARVSAALVASIFSFGLAFDTRRLRRLPE
jgi:hypothetical protein